MLNFQVYNIYKTMRANSESNSNRLAASPSISPLMTSFLKNFFETRKEQATKKLRKKYRYPSSYKHAQYHQHANRLGSHREDIVFEGEKRKIPPCGCCDNMPVLD